MTTRLVQRPRAGLLALAAAAALLAASAGGAHAATVTSFDGIRIHVNFFPAAGLKPGHRAPTVLVGPGWGGLGDTNPNGGPGPTVGYPGLGPLRYDGFNVVTWDPRGFGPSTGTVEIDGPKSEGRDVSAIITWLSRQPQALLDHPGDPRVGMAGGSYGGGIQLVSAAIDHRIDAIVPDIAWHSLVTSLDKNHTVKFGWSQLLYFAAIAANMRLDPRITASYKATKAGHPLSAAMRAFYATRGPGSLVSEIRVPTLLIEGTVDTLFTLQEAVDNYAILRHDGVPVHMLWFCGGHGACLTNPGRTGLILRDTLAWLDRYLKRRPHTATGPGFEFVDQHGGEHAGPAYPLATGPAISAHGSGTLAVNTTGGAGPLKTTGSAGLGGLSAAVAPITPAPATNAVNVRLPSPRRARLIAAAPVLTLSYRGTSSSGPERTSIFAQLVDDATGLVLGNQITPIPVRLDGRRHTLTLPLEIVAALERRGERFTLQLTPSTVAYQAQPTVGTLTFSRITLEVPTVAG